MSYLFRSFILVSFCLACIHSQAQQKDSLKTSKAADTIKNLMSYQIKPNLYYTYDRPSLGAYIKQTPRDFHQFFKQNISIYGASAMLLGTAALVVLDQPIVDASQRFGRYIGIDGTANFVDVSPVKKLPLQFPTDLPSGLYFIGDGITLGCVMGCFATYGLVAKDNRALHTALQISEGLAIVTVFTQGLKHIAGRQTPFRRAEDPDLVPGGKWRWFPNQRDYANLVPEYDAYPSGHEAAIMITLTVIAENYPECRWIRPVGYSLMTVLGFQMLNNGVHWASDYPLSIAFSYMLGKFLVPKYHKTVERPELLGLQTQTWRDRFDFKPTLMVDNHSPVLGMGLSFKL